MTDDLARVAASPTVRRVLRLGLETMPAPLGLLPLLTIATPLTRIEYLPVVVVTPVYLALAGKWARDRLTQEPAAWAWLTKHGPIGWHRPLKWGPGRRVATPRSGRFVEPWQYPALIWMLLLPVNCLAMFVGTAVSGALTLNLLGLAALWTPLAVLHPTTGALRRE